MLLDDGRQAFIVMQSGCRIVAAAGVVAPAVAAAAAALAFKQQHMCRGGFNCD
jgi:hypothetical protein